MSLDWVLLVVEFSVYSLKLSFLATGMRVYYKGFRSKSNLCDRFVDSEVRFRSSQSADSPSSLATPAFVWDNIYLCMHFFFSLIFIL